MITDNDHITVTFIGLNIVRALSIVSLILVFASSILVLVNDVEAFNEFQHAMQTNPNATAEALRDCDYIEYVLRVLSQDPRLGYLYHFSLQR